MKESTVCFRELMDEVNSQKRGGDVETCIDLAVTSNAPVIWFIITFKLFIVVFF